MNVLQDLLTHENEQIKRLEKDKAELVKAFEKQKRDIIKQHDDELAQLSDEKESLMATAQSAAKKEALQTIDAYSSKSRRLARSYAKEKEEAVQIILDGFLEQNV